MNPNIFLGTTFNDSRGKLSYNNIDFMNVKRCYVIENSDTNLLRGWQGHKVEQRWFIAINGTFKIKLIKIDNWLTPNKLAFKFEYFLDSETMDILHIPPGFISSIQSLEKGSKLFVMSDYKFDEIKDEYRFPLDYFIN